MYYLERLSACVTNIVNDEVFHKIDDEIFLSVKTAAKAPTQCKITFDTSLWRKSELVVASIFSIAIVIFQC